MADHDFDDFYASNYGRFVVQLYAVTGSLPDAEDAVQEAFARASVHWGRVRAYEMPEAWVRRVALNVAFTGLRRARRVVEVMTRAEPPPAAPLPGASMELVEALGRLPLHFRQVLVLHYLADLPVEPVTDDPASGGPVDQHGAGDLHDRAGHHRLADDQYPATPDRHRRAAGGRARRGGLRHRRGGRAARPPGPPRPDGGARLLERGDAVRHLPRPRQGRSLGPVVRAVHQRPHPLRPRRTVAPVRLPGGRSAAHQAGPPVFGPAADGAAAAAWLQPEDRGRHQLRLDRRRAARRLRQPRAYLVRRAREHLPVPCQPGRQRRAVRLPHRRHPRGDRHVPCRRRGLRGVAGVGAPASSSRPATSSAAPASPAAVSRSPSRATPRAAAVSGSASDMVAAVATVTRRSPAANSA